MAITHTSTHTLRINRQTKISGNPKIKNNYSFFLQQQLLLVKSKLISNN